MKTEIVSASNSHVTVKEESGITSVYRGWDLFLIRPDAMDLCEEYQDRLEDLVDLITKKAFLS